jgi:hypothetical protein
MALVAGKRPNFRHRFQVKLDSLADITFGFLERLTRRDAAG